MLRKAVRVSSAPPSYFLPQIINVGCGLPEAAFVDGGVSMANNPALQLLMVTTVKGFPFHWQWGKDNILMVSVGTGMSKWIKIPKAVMKSHLLTWASQIPDMFMQDASWQNQMVMQWLSYSPTAWEIDGEVGSLAKNLIAGKRESDGGYLTYLRYNMWLANASLQPNCR